MGSRGSHLLHWWGPVIQGPRGARRELPWEQMHRVRRVYQSSQLALVGCLSGQMYMLEIPGGRGPIAVSKR